MRTSAIYIEPIPATHFIPTTFPQLDLNPPLYHQLGRIDNQHVHLIAWSVTALASPTYDGQTVRSHLMNELRIHRSLNTLVSPLLGIIEKR